jgi:hypothetical protein
MNSCLHRLGSCSLRSHNIDWSRSSRKKCSPVPHILLESWKGLQRTHNHNRIPLLKQGTLRACTCRPGKRSTVIDLLLIPSAESAMANCRFQTSSVCIYRNQPCASCMMCMLSMDALFATTCSSSGTYSFGPNSSVQICPLGQPLVSEHCCMQQMWSTLVRYQILLNVGYMCMSHWGTFYAIKLTPDTKSTVSSNAFVPRQTRSHHLQSSAETRPMEHASSTAATTTKV